MSASWRNLLCFFFLGLCSNSPKRILVFVTQDMLSGTAYPSPFVMIMFEIPVLVVTLLAPWVISKIPWIISVAVCSILSVLATTVIVLAETIPVRLGVSCLLGAIMGWNICLFPAMAARFQEMSLSVAFQMGSNSADIICALYYVGLTVLACVPPRLVFASSVCFVAILVFSYVALDKQPMDKKQQDDRPNIEYKQLQSQETKDNYQGAVAQTWVGRLTLCWKILPMILCVYTAYFSLYISQLSILTTLAFPNAPFSPEDHFRYNNLAVSITRFFSGLEIVFSSKFCPSYLSWLRIKSVWLLSLITFLQAVFFMMAAWFRFVPSVGIILAMSGVQGFLLGEAMVHGLINAGDKLDTPSDKGISMGMIQMAATAGIVIALVSGLRIESNLIEHCEYDLVLGKYCLTRMKAFGGWKYASC